MKYSVKGNLSLTDGTAVINLLNNYTLWKLEQSQSVDEAGNDRFTFEAWVNSSAEKTALFGELKAFVDVYGESIDWHECTHDEAQPQQCVIAETYTR